VRFLLEVMTEELPAIPFLKELPNIGSKFTKIMLDFDIKADFNFYYTPRRLIIYSESFPSSQDNKYVEFFGPPVDIASKDGKPTNAGLSFAKKISVDFENISTTKKDNRDVLYYRQQQIGKSSVEIIPEIVNKWLSSLNFGKTMRWGSNSFEFIRPIKSIIAILDDQFIKFSSFGVESANYTKVHLSESFDRYFVTNIDNYFDILSSNKVIFNQDDRRIKILREFEELQKTGITVEIDEDLLDEVVAITEYPTALIGNFEEEFLSIPPEVIITSMKTNQRYFPVYRDDKLTNSFVVVSNSVTDNFEKVINGNQKVLRARLNDAKFFYESDIKRGFDIDGLKNITFVKQMGSLYDKTIREMEIAKILFDMPNNRGIYLSKADLLTNMVYEFTELQGVVGFYYAKLFGESDEVSLSLKEQYLPNSENSHLPTTEYSSVVALSTKLDTLLSLFSIGMLPTGTKDPFALRRMAFGIIKIVIKKN